MIEIEFDGPKPRFYTVRGTKGYWMPGPTVRAMGFRTVSCGPHGREAVATAAYWNKRVDAVRSGDTKATPGATFDTPGFIYFLRSAEQVKIGFSRNPWLRVQYLKVGLGSGVQAFITVRATRNDERKLHQAFAVDRREGEWFKLSPRLSGFMARCVVFGRIMHEEDQPPVGRKISGRTKKGHTSDFRPSK